MARGDGLGVMSWGRSKFKSRPRYEQKSSGKHLGVSWFCAWVFGRPGLSAGFESFSASNPLPVSGSNCSRPWFVGW